MAMKECVSPQDIVLRIVKDQNVSAGGATLGEFKDIISAMFHSRANDTKLMEVVVNIHAQDLHALHSQRAVLMVCPTQLDYFGCKCL